MTTTIQLPEDDRLARIERKLDTLSDGVENLSNDVESLSNDVESLSNEVESFNNKFGNYQQATQWVVQLAFTLIASATLTVIIISVLK
ncbi:MAG: hypothetical protein AAFQ89_13790 [Cyanobacteria bacterium J06626_18]